VAVVGVPDDYYGEVCAAFVRWAGPTDPPVGDALTEFLHGTVASYKIPGHWVVVDDLPKTLSGKIQKFKLNEAWPPADSIDLPAPDAANE
jgi:acyl-coenzyme A synthetase/AMP-(fatty) acid ligase